MWDLEGGVAVVRALQQPSRTYGYHVAIGGGVVNAGRSDKDLDLYFLPMGGFNKEKDVLNPDGLLTTLERFWGPAEKLSKEYEGVVSTYKHAVKFVRNGTKAQRIDCFIF